MSYDPEAVRARYLAERDKRLVPGRSAIRDLTSDEHFGRYREDPFTPVTPREPVREEVDVVVVGRIDALACPFDLLVADLDRGIDAVARPKTPRPQAGSGPGAPART